VSPAPVPITVIAGYLGAGKTTLLSHLVRSTTNRRLLVAVDEFGGLNLDVDLVLRREHHLLRFQEGCLCCTLGAELAQALSALKRHGDPRLHVVIEASGVADPRTFACWGHMPGFRLDGTIVVADATTLAMSVANGGESRIRQQFRAADLLVLNKIDLVSSRERVAAGRWLRALAPETQVVETSYARVPAMLLYGAHLPEDARLQRRRRDGTGELVAEAPPHYGAAYARWSWADRGPLRDAAFAQWAAALPASVLRAKGYLSLTGDPRHRFLFQQVGADWSVRRDSPWGPDGPGCRVSLIAPAGSLDSDQLNRSIGLCVRRPPM
jgi:G3E family GTPase